MIFRRRPFRDLTLRGLTFRCLLGSLSAVVATALIAADSAKSPDSGKQVTIITDTDESVSGTLVSLEAGSVVIDAKPQRTFKLEDVQRIEFRAALGVALLWIGQDNHDLVGPSGEAKPNGIQDMHLRLTELPADKKITQIVVTGSYSPSKPWRLDPAKTAHWRIGAENPSPTVMELYLEPNPADAFEKSLSAFVTYDDNSTVKVSTKATTHTSDSLKVDVAAPPTSQSPASAVVYLEGHNQLHGELIDLNDKTLQLRTPFNDSASLPVLSVQGVWFGDQQTAGAKEAFDKLLAKPPTEDTALVAARDKSLAQVSGSIQSWHDGALKFTYEGETKSINAARLIGLVFAAHPASRKAGIAPHVFRLANGDTLAGTWTGYSNDKLTVETSWHESWSVPRASLREVTIRNGKQTYLSDLEPIAVDETAYFDRKLSYRRDKNLLGAPLKIKGVTYRKGLAVHSRCVLTYALEGQFEKFQCTLGFDEAAGQAGRVAVQVLADGKSLWSQPDMRADGEPQKLDLNLTGAKQLTLEIDFGQNEDIGDRVIWADARVTRAISPTTP